MGEANVTQLIGLGIQPSAIPASLNALIEASAPPRLLDLGMGKLNIQCATNVYIVIEKWYRHPRTYVQ